MPTVADVAGQLDALIPPGKAGGWDPVGLQVGDRSGSVQSIAVCHEVTDAVVTVLEENPVDLLVAYHPLLFTPATSFVAGTNATGRAFRLARRGISVFVVHTAYDVAVGGTADALADALGLRNTKGFGPNWGRGAVKIVTFGPDQAIDSIARAMEEAGAGRIGQYTGCSYRTSGIGTFTASEDASPVTGRSDAANATPEIRLEMIAPASAVDRIVAALVAAHPYEEPAYDVLDVRANAGFIARRGDVEKTTLGGLAARAAAALSCTPRVAGSTAAPVASVAVLPGSGGSFISAVAGQADVLITGDVSHHQARDALDRGLAVIDVGHAPSERPGITRLYAAVAQLGLPVQRLLDLDPDPWS